LVGVKCDPNQTTISDTILTVISTFPRTIVCRITVLEETPTSCTVSNPRFAASPVLADSTERPHNPNPTIFRGTMHTNNGCVPPSVGEWYVQNREAIVRRTFQLYRIPNVRESPSITGRVQFLELRQKLWKHEDGGVL
jgi:hypothetical protein